ncbi:alanyl-tRNA editing protein [Brenneria corticis]|uniref:Threonyl/alanyl tRNA synthetase SAD domain-containing protein n=1 Tax=Brenneria corticis TaxID=2173106 RepID=A0A2U1TLI4_9GAMM|nr:alanyl-tRNA editing protein [Brenneria sp. CFCC 11842]PWC10290.1 hypothetical protein DDT56_22395 [Brenneria sp. CFCC 11842]
MTKKLYWESDALFAQVEVMRCQDTEDGRYELQMIATPFYPQGGGQPCDLGWIGDAEVSHVSEDQGVIIHYVSSEVPLGTNNARVDGERRRVHSELHSAGHLIGHVLEQLDWHPIKAHHWPGDARVVFKPGENSQPVDVGKLQLLCNSLISQNLSCKVKIREDGYREVGFGDFSAYGCGGTHVKNLVELHGLKVLSLQKKKNQLTVHYEMDVKHTD